MENQLKRIEEVRENWGWFFGLGFFLILLGSAIIGSSYYATEFSVILLGLFLICAGAIQIAQAFLTAKWSGFFISLLLGLLYLVTGFICISKPATAAVAITLWIAAFCFIAGLFRMLAALLLRFEHWGWVFFNGAVTFLLGLLIYTDWPVSGLWVIGTFIGIDLILSGWSWLVLSLSARGAD